ncbi:hypothetical protein IFM89_019966 [Coptis chinensis]|uniref:Pollen Ole e 1 allergen and extensin family protein n=1 Tax=Coptis chinensis TaxID=261450 RepID=A0A835I3V1_9MAGN|nr:hypothetical protein IFM89_019966 [Coptis chinensis]
MQSTETTNKKNMSGFHGYLALMLFLFFMVTSSVTGNPLAELSTRSELVELAGYGEEKLSSVIVTGTVGCEACLDNREAETYAWPVTGALVAISCKSGRRKMKVNDWAQEITNEYGDFLIDLPSHLHAIPYLERACVVKVLRVPKNSPCKRIRVRQSNKIELSSVGNNIRTYTAGSIRLHQTSKLSRNCLKKQIMVKLPRGRDTKLISMN